MREALGCCRCCVGFFTLPAATRPPGKVGYSAKELNSDRHWQRSIQLRIDWRAPSVGSLLFIFPRGFHISLLKLCSFDFHPLCLGFLSALLSLKEGKETEEAEGPREAKWKGPQTG